jgi:DNA-binding HxlR family transcriptional regulator
VISYNGIRIRLVIGGPRLPAHRRWTPLGRALEAVGDHWTLAIVTALAGGRMRLTHLKAALPGVSAGLLDRYVRQMVALDLISRTRIRERPPRVEVELTDTGRELVPIAGELTRWGMRRMWSAPQEGEHADLEALLRLLPALVEDGAALPDGVIETVISEPHRTVRHVFLVEQGRLLLCDEGAAATGRAPAGLRARIAGSAEAWTAALGPACERRRLRISGEAELARRVLAALAAPA